MTLSHQHIIQVGEFEIKLSNEKEATTVFDIINRLHKGQLTKAIEKFCSRYNGNNQVYRIDTLELDLGTLPAINFETNFVASFEKAFSEQLQQAIDIIHNKEAQVQQVDIDMELVVFYFTYGALPWWAGQKEPYLLSETLKRLLNTAAVQLKKELLNLLTQSNVRKRLAAMNGTMGFNQIAPVLSKHVLLLNHLIVAVAGSGYMSEKKATTLLRQVFLKTIAVGPGFTPIAFLSGVAKSLNVQPLQFVSTLETWFNKNSKAIPDQKQFWEVVKEIKNTVKSDRADNLKLLQQEQSVHDKSKHVPISLKHSNSEELYLENAGIILLVPFLPVFFKTIGVIANNEWAYEGAQGDAIAALNFILYNTVEVTEHQTPLFKVLCSLLPEDALDDIEPPNESTQSECINLLESVIAHATVLGKLSVDGFRNAYLLRPGLLTTRDGNWLIQVEKKSYDILLEKLPWSFKMVKLPWMKQFIATEW